MAEDKTTKRAIQNIVEAMVEAWNRHDARGFAACFAEDADFTNVFGIVAKGRARIESSHAGIFRTIFRDSRWAKTDTAIRLLRPDVAAVDIRWELVGSRTPKGDEVEIRYGLMNWIAVREGGTWSIAVFHNQDVPAPDRAKEFLELWKQ